jgi:outer membrane protein, heavy metal efflux system
MSLRACAPIARSRFVGGGLALVFLAAPALRADSALAASWPEVAPADSLLDPQAPDSAIVTGTLGLGDALRLALGHHPQRVAASWRVRAASSRIRDEARRPSPTLDVSEENVFGDLGTGIGETTVSLSQTLELGGDRRAREAVARGLESVAIAELSVAEREIANTAGEAFLDAWWLERRVELLARAERMARDAVDATAERVRQGAGSPVERLRAESAVAQREVERRQADAERRAARRTLALQWGASEARFDSLALPDPDPGALPTSAALLPRLGDHPELQRAQARIALERAHVLEARAARRPDLGVSAGARRLEEVDGIGFLGGVSLPLAWGTRGRGLVTAAEAERQAALAEARAASSRLEVDLENALDALAASREAYELARDRVVPAAREALARLDQGFRAGRFTYLDHWEAQRELIDAELTRVRAARDAWSARLKLETLLGVSLDEVRGTEEKR